MAEETTAPGLRLKGPMTFRFVAQSWLIGWPVFWHERRAQRCEEAALSHWHAIALRMDQIRDLGAQRGVF